MLRKLLPLFMLVGLMCGSACSDAAEPRGEGELPSGLGKLLPLHRKLSRPQPGDWLWVHAERGQTFAEYVGGDPVRPDRRRRVIYVQPLGEFTSTQRKIITLTAEFMEVYFGLPVKTREDLPLEVIPAKARRTHPSWGDKQILSTYVLSEVLYPRLPKDATAYIAFTTSDLWPGEGWNFVFGQASLNRRVGVWSIYRNGDPAASEESFRLCLRRTLKTATHETCHMFSIKHCIQYECNMCGSNHRAESDRRPLWLCPHCLAKLCWATGVDPQERFKKLIAFCKAAGLEREERFYRKSLAVLLGEAAAR